MARYQCPMHEGMRSPSPGDCKICGMEMLPIQTPPPSTLHDDDFAMELKSTPPEPKPGEPVTLTFIPHAARSLEPLQNLSVVHEHLMHLIVVSKDLATFDHVHPGHNPDGRFVIRYVFKEAGEHLLFADVTPRGRRSQVFRIS